MKKILFTCLLICALPALLFAQHSDESSGQKKLIMYEDSLTHISRQMVNDTEEMMRKNANYLFIKTLVSALKIQNSFLYPFDSVKKTISILNSPDNRFRILTWFVINDDGSYRFYGAIQMNTGGGLKLFPLNDYSPILKNPEDSIVDNKKWYGARYYKIIRVDAEKQYYTLLGWKGNNDKSTKKVIETLSFKNDKPVFGAAVFEGSNNKKRIIFEYTRQASMILNYIPEKDMIVFDHLSAPDDKQKNTPETYGPDLSYDGYELFNGKWRLKENLDMRNMPDPKTNQFVDPKKQAKKDAAGAVAGN